MWYLITGIVSIIIIILNNRQRKANVIKYVIITLLIPPVGFGLWQAEKPLLPGEERYGGKAWNVLKWVAIIHTILCFIWGIWAIGFTSDQMATTSNDAEVVGTAIGAGIGFMLIAGVWFFGILVSLIMGLILKKPITEKFQESI